jgi:hypothetical protein
MHSFSCRTTLLATFCDWTSGFAAVEHTNSFAGKSCFLTLQFATFR